MLLDFLPLVDGTDFPTVTVQSGRLGQAVPFGHWRFPEKDRKKKRLEEELLLLLSEV